MWQRKEMEMSNWQWPTMTREEVRNHMRNAGYNPDDFGYSEHHSDVYEHEYWWWVNRDGQDVYRVFTDGTVKPIR